MEIIGATNKPMEVRLLPNYADDPLVCGPRYMNSDFRCSWATYLGKFTSGILCELFYYLFFLFIHIYCV